MFVCSNRNIAYDFYKIVKELRPEWTEKKICDDGVVLSEKIKRDEANGKIKLVMTRNKDDEKTSLICLAQKKIGKNWTVSSKSEIKL